MSDRPTINYQPDEVGDAMANIILDLRAQLAAALTQLEEQRTRAEAAEQELREYTELVFRERKAWGGKPPPFRDDGRFNKCGDCSLWMTRGCPMERRDEKTGRWHGPSSKDAPCDKFAAAREVLS